MTRVLLLVLAGIAMLQQGATAVAGAPSLPFFKHYFITGDYAVQGVGLAGTGIDGFAAGDIVVPECLPNDPQRIGCVPRGLDIVAAFLYWQAAVAPGVDPVAAARGVQFRGHALSLGSGSTEAVFGKVLGAGSATCGPGGSSTPHTLRADVLRFLDQDPQTGKTAGYGTHGIRIRDDEQVAAIGASLVIVYRDSSLPFSGIVIHDGAVSTTQQAPAMQTRVDAFYEADDVNRDGKFTHIVGGGDAATPEILHYAGTRWTNPFAGTAGPEWDNPTFTVQLAPSARAIVTGAAPLTAAVDCLTWAAVVSRTPVRDDDGDGLLNIWESSATPVLDPHGRPLPLLSAMGADPGVKDVFIEVNYLTTGSASYTYGGTVEPAHTHRPEPEAIRRFGDMFKARGINVHIDLGADYDVGNEAGAEPYIVRNTVPGLARGGEALDEALTVCQRPAGAPPWVCQFSAYPGTIGWKSGLRALRDALSGEPDPLDPKQQDCDAPGNTCPRFFDEVRRDIFRYALFAHAIGLPKSTRPCLDASGAPIEDIGGQCPAGATENPDFRVPRTYSGVGDFPGGDLIVSLGGFRNAAGQPVGTAFMQASTLAHEFGHTSERRHGGEISEPNCKPGYLSVMNYLYQLRGLLDDSGTPHVDFSDATPFADVDETAVLDGVHSPSPYRLGWYAPLDTSYLAGHRLPVGSRCDGTPLEGERMVRIDARRAADPIDWNADDDIDDAAYAQDVNFNGRVNGTGPEASSGPLKGLSDDWSLLQLNQVGSRRNVGGLYYQPDGTLAVGPLSLDVGKVDLGPGDLGKVDLELGKVDLDTGKVDLGKVDLGKVDLDLGKVDLGKVDLGKVDLDLGAAEEGSGDIGRGDFGGGDLFTNDPENPLGELDATIAADLARTPPNEFRACVAGANCSAPGADPSDVVARFTGSNIGGVVGYEVHRVAGATLAPGATWTLVASVAADPGKPQDEDYVVIDTTDLADGEPFTYFAIARYADDGTGGDVRSDLSNLVTVTGVDLPLVAGDDAYETPQGVTLVVEADGILSNDGDPDSEVTMAAVRVGGPEHGLLRLFPDGSFTYTPRPGFTGVDTFRYRPVATDPAIGTVTITVTPSNGSSPPYAFSALKNAPAAAGVSFKAGSTVNIGWRYVDAAGAPMRSSTLGIQVTIEGPVPGTAAVVLSASSTGAGTSAFRYGASKRDWVFHWKTKGTNGKALPAGTYRVSIAPADARFGAAAFTIRLR